ncbi:MAG: acetyl-CoA hydrolase/transferase C-terminal domain-containing protein [Halioglobus sp.]
MTHVLNDVDACVDAAIAAVGKELVVASPLGLGKPVQLLNAFYRRAVQDSSISLHIHTALSLEVPKAGSEIEEHLAGPIFERLFGNYEELDYVKPQKKGALPDNIRVTEYYVRAGSHKGKPAAQQSYVSSNYTHILRDMCDAGVNVLAQMVAGSERNGELSLSLSCNTDLTLELFERVDSGQLNAYLTAQIHDDLPFMGGEAEVPAARFDAVVSNPKYNNTLFAVPNAAVPLQDYATGLHASSLIVDGGTLQIGIGSLGDAVAHACVLRHEKNTAYRDILKDITHQHTKAVAPDDPFNQGLYVSTEMFVNGMMHLIERGIIKRRVYDHVELQRGLNSGKLTEEVNQAFYQEARALNILPKSLGPKDLEALVHWGVIGSAVSLENETLVVDGSAFSNDLDDPETRTALIASTGDGRLKNGKILHGGFFLGPRDFYEKLNNLSPEMQTQVQMTGVSRTNQLLLNYPLYSEQRKDARFINTGMMVSLTGAVASDALEDGTVISGVGGQYNFVAMAHDLPGARSVLCIRSTRGKGSDAKSNIVPFYGHATIPKHLRDIIVTEYGIADIRGQSDAETIKRLINVADSRFQSKLLQFAKEHGKVEGDYRVPITAQNNTPERLAQQLAPHQKSGLLPDYPFGTAMTDQELALAASLREIKALSEEPAHFAAATVKALFHKADPEAARPFLERVHLEHPGTTKEFITQQLLLLELEERGLLKVN